MKKIELCRTSAIKRFSVLAFGLFVLFGAFFHAPQSVEAAYCGPSSSWYVYIDDTCRTNAGYYIGYTQPAQPVVQYQQYQYPATTQYYQNYQTYQQPNTYYSYYNTTTAVQSSGYYPGNYAQYQYPANYQNTNSNYYYNQPVTNGYYNNNYTNSSYTQPQTYTSTAYAPSRPWWRR